MEHESLTMHIRSIALRQSNVSHKESYNAIDYIISCYGSNGSSPPFDLSHIRRQGGKPDFIVCGLLPARVRSSRQHRISPARLRLYRLKLIPYSAISLIKD